MGGSSPRVFHTTPPHPALKARMTLYALSVGGAEASQNGFGDRMPAKVVRRCAMAYAPARRVEAVACRAPLIEAAAFLPSATATTVKSLPWPIQSPPAHSPGILVR